MSNQVVHLKTFEALSIVLTGFSKSDLVGTGMLDFYFSVFQKEVGSASVEDLLSAFESLAISNPESISEEEESRVEQLLQEEAFAHITKQLIQLWYLGEWIVAQYSSDNYIISSNAYLQGLVWKAIGAHPMGGKQPGFGTWGYAPLTFTSENSTN